jgi:hypothetical protein
MTTQQLLDERYGRHPRSRRSLIIIAALGIAAAIGVVAWMAYGNSGNSVDGSATDYTVTDHRTVSLTFQVTAPPSTRVACVLEADDTDHGIVGWKVVELPASASRVVTYTQPIPTVAEATTGLVNTCWVP